MIKIRIRIPRIRSKPVTTNYRTVNIVPDKYQDFFTDMNNQLSKNEIDVYRGREREVHRVFDCLLKSINPNLIVLGEHGVGKTAVVNSVVHHVTKRNCPKELRKYHFIYWDIEKSLAKLTPVIKDLLVNVLIGGFLAGIGIGMALSTGGSTGGTDIIGILLSKRNKKFTVGNIGLVFNIIVYGICGIKYGVEIMIYSILYAIFETIMIDKNHTQNICSEAFIFTKQKPDAMIEFITTELNRGATYWEAVGGYTNTKTYIVYTVLSKYERMRLGRHMKDFDEKAFMVGDDGVEIKGLFDKYLV